MSKAASEVVPETPASMRRRGLFAAAWAAVAALVLKRTTVPVSAGVDGDLVIGALTTATATTYLRNNRTDNGIVQALTLERGPDNQFGTYVANTPLIADNRMAGGYGAWFLSGTDSVATLLVTAGTNAIGVDGHTSNTAAVRGTSTSSMGVLGLSTSGIGVRGEIPAASTANATGVYGVNNSSYAGPGPGAGGFGVYGLSAKGHGLVGATAAAGGAAVVGATNGVAGAFAGAFYGPVIVGGDFTVYGAKSAAVPHPDGTRRRVYCVESPESWFEDFGKAQLTCGEAAVTLDPDFASIVDVSDYHVFLTGYDDFELRVSDVGPSGFRVQARDQAAAGRFSWRVVAKRKDIPGTRLATVDAPQEPQLPDMPPLPPTTLPEVVRRDGRRPSGGVR